jgi:hypothetical protein
MLSLSLSLSLLVVVTLRFSLADPFMFKHKVLSNGYLDTMHLEYGIADLLINDKSLISRHLHIDIPSEF